MLFGANIATCFKINTKHINTVWQSVKFLNVNTVGSSQIQHAL